MTSQAVLLFCPSKSRTIRILISVTRCQLRILTNSFPRETAKAPYKRHMVISRKNSASKELGVKVPAKEAADGKPETQENHASKTVSVLITHRLIMQGNHTGEQFLKLKKSIFGKT